MAKTRVFLSYAPKLEKSAEIAQKTVEALGDYYDIWSSTLLRPGEARSTRYDMIQQADVFLLLVEKETPSVLHVNRELGAARGKDVPIYTILLGQDAITAPRELDISELHHVFYDYMSAGFDGLRLEIDSLAEHSRQEKAATTCYLAQSAFGEPSREAKYRYDAFMIMPFAHEFTAIFDEHIKPVVQSLNLTIERGDASVDNRDIMSEVWSQICAARVVIADCTGPNVNVFYELGIAHTLGKPTLIITQDIAKMPFDIQPKRMFAYQDNSAGLRQLRELDTRGVDQTARPTRIAGGNSGCRIRSTNSNVPHTLF